VLAQQDTRALRVAVLMASDAANDAAFRNALAKLGWIEGRNLRIDRRLSSANADSFPKLRGEADWSRA
jgi:hypothetical protein